MLGQLINKKVVLVSGKGGTGKSTLAIALALLGVRQKKRVLVVEVDMSRPVVGGVFGAKLSFQPVKLTESVDGVNISFFEALQLYLSETISIDLVVAGLLKNKVVRRFLYSTPFAREVVFLNAIFYYYRSTLSGSGYDLVVVDLPSTGHAIPLLAVPGTVFRLFSKGPLLRRARLLHDFVSDKAGVAMVLTTLSEEMSVTETIEANRRIREQVPVALGPVFVNRLLPVFFSEPEGASIRKLSSNLTLEAPARVRAVLRAGVDASIDSKRAAVQLRRLESALRGPFVHISEFTDSGPEPIAYQLAKTLEQRL